MDHADHLALLCAGVEGAGLEWAELGSGAGAFTLALAELLGPGARLWSVDRDAARLERQARELRGRFPGTAASFVRADFTKPLDLANLDGILAANSLHYAPDLRAVLRLISGYLRPGGRLLLVEYDMARPSPWVPYPIPWARWQEEASRSGLQTRQLARRPSRFNGQVYSALAERSV